VRLLHWGRTRAPHAVSAVVVALHADTAAQVGSSPEIGAFVPGAQHPHGCEGCGAHVPSGRALDVVHEDVPESGFPVTSCP
jgi:hypothetical protein